MTGQLLAFTNSIRDLMQQNLCDYSVFTDGSFQKFTISESYILMSSSEAANYGHASAALVAIANVPHWQELPIVAIMLLADDEARFGLDAYSAELIALSAAVWVQNIIPSITVYTDCKSAQATIHRANSLIAKRSSLCPVRAVINSLQGLDTINVKWQRSHPERYEDHNWTREDWGIYLADLAAKGEYASMLSHHGNIIYTDILITSLLKQLIPPGTWYWAASSSFIPYLKSPITQHSSLRVLSYLDNRDELRTKRILKTRTENSTVIISASQSSDSIHSVDSVDSEIENDILWLECHKWAGTSLALANYCWRPITKGHLSSNIILKHVLDKYWHGRNRAKGNSEDPTIACCQICQATDSQIHIFLECHHPDLEDIRKNAIENVHRVADMLLAATPLCKYANKLINFFVAHFTDAHYSNVDRLWLGTWNSVLLRSALKMELI